jgi:hypothetical protein
MKTTASAIKYFSRFASCIDFLKKGFEGSKAQG